MVFSFAASLHTDCGSQTPSDGETGQLAEQYTAMRFVYQTQLCGSEISRRYHDK
jgi:hypothetical protein